MEELEKRKEKLLEYLKFKKNWIIYLILALIIWLSAFIRTRNLIHLKGKYLLALDPYIFYRYAAYIVEHGKLMALDTMRYVPLGINTAQEMTLVAYVIAYTYKFFNIFIPMTLMQFDIIYPVIFFSLSLIIFFLLTKELFNKKIAILATAFLAVIPTFLYRTMAGFSEKEPIGIFFMFLAFYFWIKSFKYNKLKNKLIFAGLSGISTGLMGLVWGGVGFVLIIIPTFVLVEFFLNKLNKKDIYAYFIWFILFLIFLQFTQKYAFLVFITSFSTGLSFLIIFILIINLIFTHKYFDKLKEKINLPHNIISLIIATILIGIITSLLFGLNFIPSRILDIKEELLHPIGMGRFILTVAEAHQPYFTNWSSEFHLFLYFFLIGSILLFYKLIKPLKKYRYILTGIYTSFLLAFIFSRYSSNSILNGENLISVFLYIGSLLMFISLIFLLYIYSYYKDKETYFNLTKINKNYIFIFIWFFLMIVAARGALRLIMLLAPIGVILASYLIFTIINYGFTTKNNIKKIICWALIILIILLPVKGSFVYFLNTSYNNAKFIGPSFDFQWQQAMEWVKEKTPEDAVFAHWWDYGYWVQTMWNRATITDGGNMIGPWNHYMGRHVLTGKTPTEALEFLKTHKTTNLLIIVDEIGKYPAYSSIGSDINYDRYSHIPSFYNDPQDVQETRNETLYLFKGTFVLDEDIIYQNKLFPKGNAIIAGIVLPTKLYNNTISVAQPKAILLYQGQQTDIPLECVYFNGKEYNYNKKGLKGCFRIIPIINSNNQLNPIGMGLYLSKKVRNTLFTQMFLFDKEWEGFTKVYDDSTKGFQLVFYEPTGRLVGPLKIWKINYPEHIKIKPEYLSTEYPEGIPQ